MRTRYSNINCAWLVMESGDYSVQHVQKCGDNSRVAFDGPNMVCLHNT